MPTDLEHLRNIRSQTLALIAELTAAPKPTYDIDGQKVAWADYLARLQSTVDWCEDRLGGEEPFEVHSRATS